jgi:protein-L-isoaspartate O-methyltransferase
VAHPGLVGWMLHWILVRVVDTVVDISEGSGYCSGLVNVVDTVVDRSEGSGYCSGS